MLSRRQFLEKQDILEDKRHTKCFIRYEIEGISDQYRGEQPKGHSHVMYKTFERVFLRKNHSNDLLFLQKNIRKIFFWSKN